MGLKGYKGASREPRGEGTTNSTDHKMEARNIQTFMGLQGTQPK